MLVRDSYIPYKKIVSKESIITFSKCSISDLKRGKAKMRNYRSVLSIGRNSPDQVFKHL